MSHQVIEEKAGTGHAASRPTAAEPISAAAFHSRVVSIYSFEPHMLGKDAFPAKFVELDEFCSFVKANARETLPLLRSELSSPPPSASSSFFYDGAKLAFTIREGKRASWVISLKDSNAKRTRRRRRVCCSHFGTR